MGDCNTQHRKSGMRSVTKQRGFQQNAGTRICVVKQKLAKLVCGSCTTGFVTDNLWWYCAWNCMLYFKQLLIHKSALFFLLSLLGSFVVMCLS
jgi:hypothetical protein